MFKNFLIMSLTAIMSGSGCLPFIPVIQDKNCNQEKYYCSTNYNGYGTDPVTHNVTITYDTFTRTYTNIDILVPNYSAVHGINACTPTAGNIITVYYDYYYPNLLADYDPTYTYNNKIYWQAANTITANNQIE